MRALAELDSDRDRLDDCRRKIRTPLHRSGVMLASIHGELVQKENETLRR